jgi:hypothetical protein
MIARELGWQALKEFLVKDCGSDYLRADDIFSLAIASSCLREHDNAKIIQALFGSASEITSNKTKRARDKSIKDLMKPLDNYKVVNL